MNNQTIYSHFKFLIKKSKPRYCIFIIGLLIGLIAIGIQLVIPQYVAHLINDIKLGVNLISLIFILSLYIISATTSSISGYLLGLFGERMVLQLRSQLFEKIINLKIAYYDDHDSGDITSRLVNDTAQIKFLLSTVLPEAILSLLNIIGILALLIFTSWKIAILILIALPLTMLVLRPFLSKFEKVGENRQDYVASLTSSALEYLKAIRLVKYSNGESTTISLIQSKMKNLFLVGRKEVILQSIVGPLLSTSLMILIFSILTYGYSLVSKNEISIGILISILMYLFQLVAPVGVIGRFFGEISETKGATQRLIGLFEAPEENFSIGDTFNIKNREIAINHVTFGYESNVNVLNDITIHVKPNSLVAIVGPSGSGKSTLLNLIEMFYMPDRGDILIGDMDIRKINLQNWRKQIGFVEQNTTIFSGTVRDNLIYGLTKHYPDSEIWKALELANAKEFVSNFNEELDTRLGENGQLISGGERQRISIARAFLRNPTILILDEATANLDSESEKMIQISLEKLMQGRTTFVIAHRLSTIINADIIYFIENGKITGQGTHEHLIKNHQLYKKYVDLQVLKK